MILNLLLIISHWILKTTSVESIIHDPHFTISNEETRVSGNPEALASRRLIKTRVKKYGDSFRLHLSRYWFNLCQNMVKVNEKVILKYKELFFFRNYFIWKEHGNNVKKKMLKQYTS